METQLHPSLEAALASGGLDPNKLALGIPFGDREGPGDRGSVFLVAGDAFADWHVPALSSLFRGNRAPPDMTEYPPAYVPAFYLIERSLLLAARLNRVPTDAELEEAFANLRRRPDGRSLGRTHDLLWQASALALGRFVLSGAEFGAVVGRLARSAKTWKRGPTSREYVGYLRRSFE